MEQALSFGAADDVHSGFAALSADINSPSASYVLKLANRLYGEATSKFLQVGLQICNLPKISTRSMRMVIWLEIAICCLLQEFLDATEKYYQADLKAVDFVGAPEDCRAEINSWVEQQTESRKSPHWREFQKV